MARRGQYGHVINISSMSGHRVPDGAGGGAFYSATKFALRALTEGLRQEVFCRLSGNVTPRVKCSCMCSLRWRQCLLLRHQLCAACPRKGPAPGGVLLSVGTRQAELLEVQLPSIRRALGGGVFCHRLSPRHATAQMACARMCAAVLAVSHNVQLLTVLCLGTLESTSAQPLPSSVPRAL